MRRKNVQYEEDDGETIVNMNVDGMPWHRDKKDVPEDPNRPRASLSSAEGRAALSGTIIAALVFIAIFIGGALLFILFCQKVWLK